MKTFAYIPLAVCLTLPLSVGAASIHVVNQSSSYTGGISVSAGSSATSDSDASSEVRTVIKGNAGGTAEVTVTSKTGDTERTETRRIEIPADSMVRVSASASSSDRGGGGVKTDVRVERAAGTVLSATATAPTTISVAGAGEEGSATGTSRSFPVRFGFIEAIRSFFSRIFSILKGA